VESANVRARYLKRGRGKYLGLTYCSIYYTKNGKCLYWQANEMKQRIFDLSISILLFLPFITAMLIILLVLYSVDGKKPFFVHQRIGKNGKPFLMFKFRTMHLNSEKMLDEILEKDPSLKDEWYENYKLRNDPRISFVGKFLRKTSLDELPQYFNILQGSMSWVGPRPIVNEELEKYGKFKYVYLSMKPGLTGLWQIGSRNDESYEYRIKTDSKYYHSKSFFLDLLIIIKTVSAVIRGKGQ